MLTIVTTLSKELRNLLALFYSKALSTHPTWKTASTFKIE